MAKQSKKKSEAKATVDDKKLSLKSLDKEMMGGVVEETLNEEGHKELVKELTSHMETAESLEEDKVPPTLTKEELKENDEYVKSLEEKEEESVEEVSKCDKCNKLHTTSEDGCKCDVEEEPAVEVPTKKTSGKFCPHCKNELVCVKINEYKCSKCGRGLALM